MGSSGDDWIGSIPESDLIGLLLERVSAAIALLDRDMRYIACNRRWITENQLEDDNIIGRSHFELFPEVAEVARPLHDRALAGETVSNELDRIERKDGTIDWVRWSMAPWHYQAGIVQGVLLIFELRTAQLEEELRTRVLDEELSMFIDIADNYALCLLDDEGKVSIWNAGAERMFGWQESEIMGKPYDFLFEPLDQDLGLPARQLKVARKNGAFRDRSWRLRKDGSRFLAEVTISRIEGDEQLPSGFGKIVRDVTQDDVQARSLEASAVLLRSILDTVPDAMIVIDEDGRILSFSKAAVELFGYAPGEVIGRNVSMLMASPDRERHDSYLARYKESGVPRVIGTSRRVFGLRKDGTTFPHTLRIGEARVDGSRMFAGFIHDLTETEETEKRLTELQQELAHIARVNEMGTLATTIAHELNQPLMAIGNIVQTSAELVRNGDQRALGLVEGALEDAAREALRAGEIVKRLRKFVSRGELERTIEAPLTLARDASALASADVRLRGVDCKVLIADGLADILVDRVQIQQVLFNLVRNAAEAIGQNGTIRISAHAQDGAIHFIVADSGPGVSAEKLAGLFEPFSTTKPDGMGMGLAICRSIIEAHGGRLWYENNQPDGAAFHFTLPQFDKENADAN